MHLTIDIGNTRGKLVVFDEKGNPKAETITDGRTLENMAEFAACHQCRQGIVSSTIGLTKEAERHLDRLPFPVLRLTGKTPLPIRNLYRTPDTLGTDRLTAIGSLQPGHNLLVVDCGTCITYDFIDSEVCYRGGNICEPLLKNHRKNIFYHINEILCKNKNITILQGFHPTFIQPADYSVFG